MSESPKDESKPQDVVLLHSPTEDGEGIRVLRAREESRGGANGGNGANDGGAGSEPKACVVEVGEVRPLKEGQPIAGEVVRLKPREGAPRVCDVEVMAKVPGDASALERGGSKKGPAQVATHAYRASWERIFGPPTEDNRALN